MDVLSENTLEDDFDDELEKNETEEHEFSTSYKLNCFGIDFDVSGLVRRQNSGSIYLPEFQRNYVWSKNRASRFIESLLLGLPIPSVCLYREEDNKQIIIDGFQRLESIKLFYNKEFADGSVFRLSGISEPFNGKTIDDLDSDSKLKLDDTLIHATIVKADDPQERNYNAVYLIFERLNTGGVKLTPQEIRSCIYHGEFQKIIEDLSKNLNYTNTFKITPKRKKDQEIVLRLFALAINYKNYSGNMKEFLNEFMDSNKKKNRDNFSKEISIFEKTMEYIAKLKNDIFKPKGNINLAILDAVFVGTYTRVVEKNIVEIEEYQKCIEKMVETPNFKNYIETGKTHHTAPLKERIELAINEISKVK